MSHTAPKMFEIGPGVREQARALGMFGNVEERLCRMARQAAPFGNGKAGPGMRRFESYLIRIVAGAITEIRRYVPEEWPSAKQIYADRRDENRLQRILSEGNTDDVHSSAQPAPRQAMAPLTAKALQPLKEEDLPYSLRYARQFRRG